LELVEEFLDEEEAESSHQEAESKATDASSESNDHQREFALTSTGQQSTTYTTSIGNTELVEATPVDSNLQETNDLNPEYLRGQAMQRKMKDQRRIIFAFSLVAAVVSLMVAAVILITFFCREASPPNSATEAPSLENISMALTESPTAATLDAPDLLWRNLPTYTKESLKNISSPQSLAWAWLKGHQNLTNIPEWRRQKLFSLATFYYAFNGPNWAKKINQDWLDDKRSECDWYSTVYGFFKEELKDWGTQKKNSIALELICSQFATVTTNFR
jgi:hypothetical protein